MCHVFACESLLIHISRTSASYKKKSLKYASYFLYANAVIKKVLDKNREYTNRCTDVVYTLKFICCLQISKKKSKIL